MNLTDVRVRNYKVIDDTGWVAVDDLLCLVGKNESGKTVFMEALEKLNPGYGDGEFVPFEEFPRHRWVEYRDRHEDDPEPVTSARFELDDGERERLESEYGTLDGTEVTVTKDFANNLDWEIPFADEDIDPDTPGNEMLVELLPEFRYIGEYSVIEGTIDVPALVERRDDDELDASDEVFLSLLSIAGLELDELAETTDWRDIRTELEAASGELTSAVSEYWSQTDDLDIRIEQADTDSEGLTLAIRLENLNQDVTVEFEQRSRGFRQFFSVFCQLQELRQEDSGVVLMLDEPGLNLHPKAKREFLQFLEQELAVEQPLIYTAHSPFMIDPERIHRTKMIQKDMETGSTILSDVSDADAYTRFPLQNAFELDLMDSLLSRSRVLLVQNRSVHTYLYGISELMETTGSDGLNPRWTVLPITTVDNVETFLGLFDSYDLDTAVLLEGESTRELPEDVTVHEMSEFVSVQGVPTIEDLLSETFYLRLVNRAYADALANTAGIPDRLSHADLPERTADLPIIERLDAYFESEGIGPFERAVPARYFREHHEEFTDQLDTETKRSFGTMVKRYNDLLDSVSPGSSQRRSFTEMLFGN